MQNNESNNSVKADLSLLLVALIWGSGFVVTKNALISITPLYLLSFRFILAFILMTAVFWKRVKNINKENVIGGVVIGIFLYSAFAAQTIGLLHTSAGKQAFLTGTNVVMVPFLYWLVKKNRPDVFNIIAAILAFVGIAFLTIEGGLYINIGDGLTILCAFLFACHIVSIGHYAIDNDPIILTMLQFGVAGILSLGSALVFESFPIGVGIDGVLAIAYLGMFSTLIAFLIQNVAQKYTSPTHAAIMLSLESVFGSILSAIILGERFTLKMFLGCLVIFLGIITAETKWNFSKGGKKDNAQKEI